MPGECYDTEDCAVICLLPSRYLMGIQVGSRGKESTYNAGDAGLSPGSGRSPGEGNGNPLQYSCPVNPKVREASWAIVHGIAKSWTQLSIHTQIFDIVF